MLTPVIFVSAFQFHVYFTWVNACLDPSRPFQPGEGPSSRYKLGTKHWLLVCEVGPELLLRFCLHVGHLAALGLVHQVRQRPLPAPHRGRLPRRGGVRASRILELSILSWFTLMFVDTNLQVDVIELTEVSYLWVEKLEISWTEVGLHSVDFICRDKCCVLPGSSDREPRRSLTLCLPSSRSRSSRGARASLPEAWCSEGEKCRELTEDSSECSSSLE